MICNYFFGGYEKALIHPVNDRIRHCWCNLSLFMVGWEPQTNWSICLLYSFIYFTILFCLVVSLSPFCQSGALASGTPIDDLLYLKKRDSVIVWMKIMISFTHSRFYYHTSFVSLKFEHPTCMSFPRRILFNEFPCELNPFFEESRLASMQHLHNTPLRDKSDSWTLARLNLWPAATKTK